MTVIVFSVVALVLALTAGLLLIRRHESRWDAREQTQREAQWRYGVGWPVVYQPAIEAAPVRLALSQTRPVYGARRFDKPTTMPLWCERTDEHGTIGWAVI